MRVERQAQNWKAAERSKKAAKLAEKGAKTAAKKGRQVTMAAGAKMVNPMMSADMEVSAEAKSPMRQRSMDEGLLDQGDD